MVVGLTMTHLLWVHMCVQAVKDLGFKRPTPVQVPTCVLALFSCDCVMLGGMDDDCQQSNASHKQDATCCDAEMRNEEAIESEYRRITPLISTVFHSAWGPPWPSPVTTT